MDPQDRRKSCHLCGNIRKGMVICNNCPQIYCFKCAEKLATENGEEVFHSGCPVCKEICCCVKRSLCCTRLNHCYRRCPAQKNLRLAQEAMQLAYETIAFCEQSRETPRTLNRDMEAAPPSQPATQRSAGTEPNRSPPPIPKRNGKERPHVPPPTPTPVGEPPNHHQESTAVSTAATDTTASENETSLSVSASPVTTPAVTAGALTHRLHLHRMQTTQSERLPQQPRRPLPAPAAEEEENLSKCTCAYGKRLKMAREVASSGGTARSTPSDGTRHSRVFRTPEIGDPLVFGLGESVYWEEGDSAERHMADEEEELKYLDMTTPSHSISSSSHHNASYSATEYYPALWDSGLEEDEESKMDFA